MAPLTRRLLRWPLILAWVTATVGCALRPQPEPPTATSLDPTRLFANPSDPASIMPASGLIQGAPGAAEPAGAIVRAYNLDRPDAPAETTVRDDGSFDLELTMAQGEEVRVQVQDGPRRTVPVDLLIGAPATVPQVSVRTLAACLILAPSLELQLPSTASSSFVDGSVQVSNLCDHPIDFAAPRVRREADGLELLDLAAWPAQLSPGMSATVRLRYQGPDGGLDEILFVEATAPVRDRRPISVRSAAPP